MKILLFVWILLLIDNVSIGQTFHQNIISKDTTRYNAFPSICQVGNSLYLSYVSRVNASHSDTTGGMKYMVSNDYGLTWTVCEKFDYTISKKYCHFIMAEGRVFVDKSKKDSLIEQGKQIVEVDSNTIGYLSSNYIRIKNNKQVKEMLFGDTLQVIGLPNMNGCIVSSNKVSLQAIYGNKIHENLDYPFILRSTNKGKNWNLISILKEDSDIGINETALVETVDHKIIAMMRSSNNGHLYQSVSIDDGLTWTTPKKTAIWGYPASLIRLKNDDILCTYGYRKKPIGIRAVVSKDNGISWDLDNEIILRNDANGYSSDTGYPISIEYEGKILTIYYISINNIVSIQSTIWRME